jgi:hypothetical protein
MRQVSDAFLLNVAEVSASLVGLFLVGVFFYVETGLHRSRGAREVFQPYLRAGTRITLIVFAIPIGLSLALVALEPVWVRLVFLLLSVLLVAANVDSAVRVRGVARVTRSRALLLNEIVTTVLAITLVVLPWILGGLHPSRGDVVWAILLAFAAGFLSIGATVISAFDFHRVEALAPPSEHREADPES